MKQAFDITPAASLVVDVTEGSEPNRLFSARSEDGSVMMSEGKSGTADHPARMADRSGVSWRLNLP